MEKSIHCSRLESVLSIGHIVHWYIHTILVYAHIIWHTLVNGTTPKLKCSEAGLWLLVSSIPRAQDMHNLEFSKFTS